MSNTAFTSGPYAERVGFDGVAEENAKGRWI